jgi:hypothetical protein
VFFGEIDPVLMWLNAFSHRRLRFQNWQKSGGIKLQASRREVWENTIFELAVLAVLIAIVWVILSL